MFYKKQGTPEEHDVVICTVTKIQPHSVFVNVNEYDYSGMIHISEIAPGRIRNIRDYVKETKVIVCKVLRVNPEKRQVDLSLRRVSEIQRRTKINEMKHEQRAESIIDHVAKELSINPRDLYTKVSASIFAKYDFLFQAFEDVVENGMSLASLGIEKNISEKLEEIIRQRIKPKEIEIKGFMNIKTYDPTGIEIIKTALIEGGKRPEMEITYLGGGRYQLLVKAKEYKVAEPVMKEAVDFITDYVRKNKGIVEFVRETK